MDTLVRHLPSLEAKPRLPETELTTLLTETVEANAWLQMAERFSHIGHYRFSLPEGRLTWSDGVYRIYGVTRQSYRPELESVIGFYHPDDRALMREAVAATTRDQAPYEFSGRLVRADGKVRHVQSRGLTMAEPDGSSMLVFGVIIDITERKQVEQALREANLQLEQEAHMDALTGLANRRLFDKTLQEAWQRAMQDGTALSVVMLDIDRFKGFNDRYGHLAGDQCLRVVARTVAQAGGRAGGSAARYGGEELALILPATDASAAGQVASETRQAIEALGLVHAGNASCGGLVTASLGVATAQPRADSPLSDWSVLIAEADGMLYEAKRTGRNRVVSPAARGCSGAAPRAADEAARLAVLAAYEQSGAIRRTAELNRIARLAATLTGSPVSLISLILRDEQHFIGNFGTPDMDPVGRDISPCGYTILGDEPLVVADATQDERFAQNVLVTGGFGLRYYAGAPILCRSTRHRLGSLCVIDRQVRPTTSPAQRALLTDLAEMVASLIEDDEAVRLAVSATALHSQTEG